LPEIRCQSCLSPGSEPTPLGGFSPLSQGLPRGIRSPLVVPPKTVKHPCAKSSALPTGETGERAKLVASRILAELVG
jgi:hypothetical protein